MEHFETPAPALKVINRFRSLPFLLYSYIASEMLAPFFASFIILYSIFFLVRLVPLLDIVLDLRIGLGDFIRMFSYIFPHMVFYVIPMASMIGVTLAFTRLTSEREMLALKASGISLRQLLPPVIVIALAISLLTAFVSIRLMPAGNVAMKHLFYQLAREKIDKGLQERTFTETLGDLVVYVDNIDDKKHWQGVYISDTRDRTQPLIIMAERGQLVADLENMIVTIILGNGTIHNMDDTDNQTVQFSRYQLNIPINSPTRVHGEDVTVLDRGAMSQKQLLEVARERGVDTKQGVIYLTEFHERLVLPVGCFVLSLLGIPLGMQAGPGRRAIGIPLALTFFVAYHILTTLGSILSEDLVVHVLIGMWLPTVVMIVVTFFIFRRVEQEKPIISSHFQNRILDFFERFGGPAWKTISRVWNWLLHWRPGKEDDLAVYHPGEMKVHANPEEKIFHMPGCEQYDCPMCTIQFKDVKIAKEAGFSPCPICGDS